MSGSAAITLENVTLGYGHSRLIERVSGRFERGSLTAVVGPNGAGKSTLLKAIVGMLSPWEGHVAVHAGQHRRHLAYLPQRAEIDRSFPISVEDLVAAGLWHEVGPFGGIGAAARRRAEEALRCLGLEHARRQPIGSLSVGQFQRALFARLLLQSASTILLDEPFNAVDSRTTGSLLALLAQWHAEGRTVVAVLHDLDQVRQHFPHSLLLARRIVAWGTTERVLTSDNLGVARSCAANWDEERADTGWRATG